MNNLELQAARKLLMLDASEAAEEIGNVSTRSWQYWEAGDRAVPDDVVDEMLALISIRMEKIDELDQLLAEAMAAGEEKITLEYYISFEQYQEKHPGARKMEWRLNQSVAALYFTEGLANLAEPQ